MAGALLALVWAFPMFWLFDTGNPRPDHVRLLRRDGRLRRPLRADGGVSAGALRDEATLLGASVSYNLGGMLGVAFAPILASSLLIVAGGSWAISLYIALMAGISLACLSALSETHLSDISGMRQEERELLAEDGVVRK